MIERKQKGTVARRKEKVRGGGRKPREAHSDLGGCRISWPFSPLLRRACRSFFVRCLQSFPGRYPAQGSCRGSCPDSPATVRYHTYTASFCLLQVFSSVYLVVSLPPAPLSTCSQRHSLLFSRLRTTVCGAARCCDGGDGDDGGGSSSSSSWWRRIPEL